MMLMMLMLKMMLTQANAAGDLAGVIQKSKLINDFIGVGLGLTALDPADVVELHAAQKVPQGPMVGIGAGTGLGEVCRCCTYFIFLHQLTLLGLCDCRYISRGISARSSTRRGQARAA